MNTNTMRTQNTTFTRVSTSNLSVSLVCVTPDLALEYLKCNNKNRKADKKNIHHISSQMTNGLFIENGESIVFDTNNELKDGQHRLLAIVKSGLSFFIPVVRGVVPSSMATYDTGKNRTSADILYLNGYKYSSAISSLIKAIYKFTTTGSKHSRLAANNRYETLTNQEVLEYCDKNYEWLKDLAKNAIAINSKATVTVLNNQTLGLVLYMIGGKTPSEEAYQFTKHLAGVIRTEETATNYLYAKLHKSRANREPLNTYWVLGMILKSWNYFIEGNPPVKYFTFNVSQDLPEINK
tara:strand:+ start:59 stop:940 length:882 start_codon:yes stop_codon:yes gene_type:complete